MLVANRRAITRAAKAIVIVVVIVAVAAATGAYYLTLPKGPSTIKIGALMELTGVFGFAGTPNLEGMKFAVKKMNDAGGVLGAKIELVVGDTKSDPKEAVTLFQRMVEVDHVVAVCCTVSSDVGIALSQQADRLKVPLLLTYAVSEKVLTKDSRYTFRSTGIAAPTAMGAIGGYIKARGYTRVGIIIADYAYGRSAASALNSSLGPIPGIQLSIQAAPVRETDFSAYLRKLQVLQPQAIVIAHPPGDLAAVKQIAQFGMNAEVIVAAADDWSKFGGGLGPDVFRIKLVDAYGFFDPNNPDYVKIAGEFRKETGTFMDKTTTAGYMQILLIAQSIKEANSLDPSKIRDALSATNYQAFNSYPFSHTPWGELRESRLVFSTWKPGPAPDDVNPGAQWHVEVLSTSPPLAAFVPT